MLNCVVPIPSYSHQIVFQPLWRELSLKDHQLTILTTDPMNNSSLSNITEIDLKFSYEIVEEKHKSLIGSSDRSVIDIVKEHFEVFDKMVDAQLSHPDVEALIKNNNTHFDLLIVEPMHPAAYAFSRRFKCSFIVMSTGVLDQFHHYHFGNPVHPILYPEREISVAKHMSFLERLEAVARNIIILKVASSYAKDGIVRIIEKHFGKDCLPVEDLLNKISLIFDNTDPILHPVRPLVPGLIQIGGGASIRPSKPLPILWKSWFLTFHLICNRMNEFLDAKRF